jgi:hypothetical protein
MELLSKCNDISISVTEEEVGNVEIATRQQSQSKLWYKFRSGRITASKMKSVCSTDSSNPSQSLIMSICYPSSHQFSSEATAWGLKNEKLAIDKFVQAFIAEGHENVTVENCGLFISSDSPWLAATPDCIISCDCCGKSTVEVKCPFSKKNDVLKSDGDFYIIQGDNGELSLDNKHNYYFQVQTQLGVTKCESCFFIVWTEKDIHIEEIDFDKELWDTIQNKSEIFFRTAILPELVGKFYSRLPGTGIPTISSTILNDNSSNKAGACENVPSSSNNEETWCYCNQVESGNMVYCDNENCDIKWFHFTCLKLSNEPKSKLWYCPDCRKLPEYSRKRIKKC